MRQSTARQGDVMNSGRQILWKVLVAGMIPFILGAGLPQMECKCAAANGQLFCECCFRKPDESRSDEASSKACCRKNSTSPTGFRKASSDSRSSSGCATCHMFKTSQTGSCCSLKQASAPTLSQQVEVSEIDVLAMCLPMFLSDSLAAANPLAAREHARSRLCCESPPLDRVIVFGHLVI